MQIPIVDGRDFDDRDQPKTQRVVIVNQQMAETLWPGESAVGKRISIGDSRDLWEVVGVVKTGKYRTLAEDPKPFFYYAMGQRRPAPMAMVVRASVDPRSLAGAIRSEVQGIDRRVPLSGVKTMDEHKTYALWAPNMAASFSVAFAVVAILLSAVGLYSVMAYVVSQRTREVGIRMALGAQARDVVGMIFRQGIVQLAVGMTLGLALAFGVARLLSAILFQVEPRDPVIFSGVAAVLVAVGMLACLVPARRATLVDPLVALRAD
jgi:predicted permease